MSATCVWTGGLRPMNVTVVHQEGGHLPDGHWEAEVCGTDMKVFVRPEDLEPVFVVTTGGAS
jgi:hypothetical protein